jgi:hypothetical protein
MKPLKFMDRRRFLFTSAVAAVSIRALAQSAPDITTITLHPEDSGPHVPGNFVGLSYETQQLSNPGFFSTANTGLIAKFRELAPRGVLRIGGNTSDVGWWKATPSSKQPSLPANVTLTTSPGSRPPMDLAYAVTPEAVRNLRAFLNATGWSCLYGINLGTNTPQRAAEEAAFVADALGPKLEYFQIGNEPDLFYRRFRERSAWNVDAYLDQWLAAADAIRTRVPSARFGLPDTSGNPEWSSAIADRLAALHDRPDIAAISHHYYFGGPPSNPDVNIDSLLRPDPKVQKPATTMQTSSAKLSAAAGKIVPWRLTEGNTCYRGGKPGVSDVFAASLWAADYLLTLASLGYAGANLHGGSGKDVADSLGGTLPGELLMPDPTAPHPRPFYTPIAEIDGHYVAEPVFYGMLFAQHFAGTTLIPVDLHCGAVNATAYAAKLPSGGTLIAIINKDSKLDLQLDAGMRHWTVEKILSAPSLTSKQISFAAPAVSQSLSMIPRASAVLLTRRS